MRFGYSESLSTERQVRVWYKLVNEGDGTAYRFTPLTSIRVGTRIDVDLFRDAVHAQKNLILNQFDSPQLTVYEDESTFRQRREQPLPSDWPLRSLGKSRNQPLIVAVPNPWRLVTSAGESFSYPSTYILPETIPSLDALYHPFCAEYADKNSSLYAYEKVSGTIPKGTFTEVVLPYHFLADAGIYNSPVKRDVVLFLRDRSLWEIKFIIHDVIEKGCEGYIQGPSGTGVSITALMTAAALCRDQNWNVLWIHAVYKPDGELVEIACLHLKPDCTVGKLTISPDKCIQLIWSFTSYSKCLLIIDGVNKDESSWITLRRPALDWFRAYPRYRRVILLTSPVYINIKDSHNMKIFRQWSWTMSEYQEALRSQNFRESVQFALDSPSQPLETDVIMAKYFYAGGCARYMFSLTFKQVEQAIKVAVRSFLQKHGIISNPSLFELHERFFISSADKDKRSDMVSEYTRREIQKTFGYQWLHWIAHADALERRTRGLLFQEWVVKQIEYGEVLYLTNLGGVKVTLPSFVAVDRRSLEGLTLANTQALTFVSFTDEKEASIDALFYTHRGKADDEISLSLLKITTEKSPKLDLKVCRDLAKKFNAKNVEIHFVAPYLVPPFGEIQLLNIEASAEMDWPTTNEALTACLNRNVWVVDGWTAS